MYTEDGTNTTTASEAATYVYHLTLKKLVAQSSVNNIMNIKKSGSPSVTIELPSAVQLSSPPLTGSYRITCPGPEGNDLYTNPYQTEDIPYGTSNYWIQKKIFNNCSDTYDSLEVYNANTFSYRENGISLYVRFIGMNGEHA
jgi:hypothetical protein